MTLDQFHTKLLDSFRACTTLVIEPHEMAELFNEIKEILLNYEIISERYKALTSALTKETYGV